MKAVLITWIWVVAQTAALAQSGVAHSITKQLDTLYSTLHAENRFNGSVLVAEKGKVIYSASFGFADFEKSVHNDSATVFHLASLSKVFTATAVLQLIEKRRLTLHDPLSKFFPDFPYRSITIEQLLSHSSGLSDQDLAPAIERFEKANKRRHTNNDLVPLIKAASVSLRLSPGEKWWYCNLGYELLASLVEKVSREKFGKYLQKHIFGPAGMLNTSLTLSTEPASGSYKRAGNYDYKRRYSATRVRVDLNMPDYTEAAFGHSNIMSSTADLLKFDRALKDNRLLGNHMLNGAYQATKLRTGADNIVWMDIGGMGNAVDGQGWFIFTNQTMGKTVWHAGGMQGAVTIMLRNVDKDQLVIILDNTGSEGIYRSAFNGLRLLNEQPLMSNKRNLARIYGRALFQKDADHAITLLQSSIADTANFTLSENDLNNMGYAFLADSLTQHALETLKVNCLLFPASDNVYNSYGEALLTAGKTDEAIRMYKKSLALNPANTDSRQTLSRLLNQ